jgi:N-6 DNA Methylase
MARTATALIDAAQPHFPAKAYRGVRLPEAAEAPGAPHGYVEVDALFTSDGARPRWDNLGLIVHRVAGEQDSVERWRRRLVDLPVAGVLLTANDNFCLLLPVPGQAAAVHPLPSDDRLPAALAKHARSFAPRDLAAYRTGQLSFADAAEHLSPGTLAFASRHREDLHSALTTAVTGALAELPARRANLREPVFRFALAYLGARILEDKGFFDRTGSAGHLENDPRVLLARTVKKTNGFFKTAYEVALPKLEKHPSVLKALAAHLGPATTFALVDHHDLGRFYELLIDILRTQELEIGNDLVDLQQYYTPMALTERILAHLPLERIRPKDRVIFDPTAGSGSFLLAATQRLAAMTDLPDGLAERSSYLAKHVVGNDRDPHVKDIAWLRYYLIQESERSADLFPRPEQFGHDRYEDLTRDALGIQRGVVVANPPYAEKRGAEQQAAVFVRHALSWLDDGAQYAFVLPQTLMIQSTHGMDDARRELSRRSRILEVWQVPEGVVGIAARQAVCIILGIMGDARTSVSVSRAIISGAEVARVRTAGLLGASWLSRITTTHSEWREAIMPPIKLPSTWPHLSDVFHVFSGPTPEAGAEPASEAAGPTAGPYFSFDYVGDDRLWANPERRPRKARWLNHWRFIAKRNAAALSEPKIIVSRATNRGARRPYRICYDDRGHWPSMNHHCISPRATAAPGIPAGYEQLTSQERLFWLAGVLSSSFAVQLILGRRGARHTDKNAWLDLPLPSEIDPDVIQLVRTIIAEEQGPNGRALLPLRQVELDTLVWRAYGAPRVSEIRRTGPDHWNDQLAKAWQEPGKALVAQAVDVDQQGGEDRILLHLSGMEPEQEAWVPLPLEMPGWALDGTSFVATVPERVRSIRDLEDRAALRDFKHPPRDYESLDELEERLRKLGLV